MSRYLGAAPGFLVAVDLPPGPAWLDVVGELWTEGVAFLPLDRRVSDRERRAVVDRAAPTSVIGPDGETVFADPSPVADAIALVVATSGTAGRPKLVELTRSGSAAAVGLSLGALGPATGKIAVDPSDPWVCCLSPAHMGGMLVLLRALVFGSPVTVLPRFDPSTLVRDAPPGAHVSLVPTMLARLLETGADLARLGVLLVGGGPLDPAVAERAAARGARIVTTYGLTETCGGVVYDGRPFDGTDVRIATDGGIELRGPTVMEGYLADPVATAAAFTLDGWLRTADIGELEDDGRLRVRGRRDDAIRTGAETVWPREVEEALRDHPKVADVVVAARRDPEWGERVVAFVVPARPDDPPTIDELRVYASERIARFKAPREIVLMDALPRTPSGKLRRTALPR